MDPETSDEPKPSVSSSSSGLSPGLEALADTLRLTVITKESLKAGGTLEAKIEPQISSSVEFFPSSMSSTTPSLSTQHMFPVNPTLLTLLPEGSTPQPSSFYPKSSYQLILAGSLLTQLSPTLLPKSDSSKKVAIPLLSPTALATLSGAMVPVRLLPSSPHAGPILSPPTLPSSHFSSLLPVQDLPFVRSPHKYLSNLTPLTSDLCPHCPACDRLRLWKPTFVRSSDTLNLEITDSVLDRLITVINTSWQSITRETYGAGLLVFHVFCEKRAIPEDQHCPADPLLMLTFISSCAGSYSGKTLANYFYAVHAWHTLHGAPWHMNAAEMKAALDRASILAPPASRKPKRSPMTVSIISSLATKFNLTKPLDAAVFTCLTTTFYSAAHLGEFTLPSLKSFIPEQHVKPSDVHHNQDRHGLQVTVFRLPRTKSSIAGEEVFWAVQPGVSDPQAAFSNHLAVNNPPPDLPLFFWRHPNGLCALTRNEFLKRINLAASELGIDSLKGHGIRIGTTLEYLLRGVPFDVVKSIGRWSSEAFLLYLCQHAVIIAPYIQGTPIMDAFTCYTMPPPR